MKSFLPTKISKIKNLSQNKTKTISKRGKGRVGKELEARNIAVMKRF